MRRLNEEKNVHFSEVLKGKSDIMGVSLKSLGGGIGDIPYLLRCVRRFGQTTICSTVTGSELQR